MTTLLLVRHGESQAHLECRFAGSSDFPLTELGHRQAQCTGAFIRDNYPVDAVYASNLQRAYDTGVTIAGMTDSPIFIDSQLREIFAGQWETRLFKELQEQFAEDYGLWLTDIGHSRCTGGESMEEVANRAWNALRRIAEENPGKTLLIATHGGFIRALLWYVSGQPLSHMKNIPWVSNASVTELCYTNGALTPVKVSQDSHLADLRTIFPPNV